MDIEGTTRYQMMRVEDMASIYVHAINALEDRCATVRKLIKRLEEAAADASGNREHLAILERRLDLARRLATEAEGQL